MTTTTRLLILGTDDTVRPLESSGLEDLQGAVGGYIEFVQLDDRIGLYCNEEAKLSDPPLEPNLLASAIVQGFHPTFLQHDYIAGPAVLIGIANAKGVYDGDTHSVPEAAEELVNAAGAVVREMRARAAQRASE